jgi:hypothetical protein
MVQQSDGGTNIEKASSVHSLVELVVSRVAVLSLFHREGYGGIRDGIRITGEMSSSI